MSLIDQITPEIAPVRGPETAQPAEISTPDEGFSTVLDHLVENQAAPSSVETLETLETTDESALLFSRHASSRLKSRGIELSEQDLADISDAIDRLSEKNARQSLVLMGDNAFIVGVPKRTVITAMPRQEAVGSIFTNIDSTMVVR